MKDKDLTVREFLKWFEDCNEEKVESEYICTTAMLPGPRTPLRFKTAMNILKDDSFFALAEKLRRMMNNKEDME